MDKSGALSDRWNKKVTMLVCDLFAAGTTAAVFLLLHTGRLAVWHLYALNILNGLMNTVQQPASEVASTLLIPKRHFQRTSGLRSLSSAVNSVLTPIAATAVLGLFGLGAVNTCAGLAMLAGSLLVSLLPAPKSRVRVICNALLFSMSTENFLLALGHSLPVWCVAAVLGWISIPLMNANMDVLLRTRIPVGMQGRVYAARNTLQFFTIPLGYLAGGFLVDSVFEPFMAAQPAGSLWTTLFGAGKGAGAALLFLVIGFLGMLTCLVFRRSRSICDLEKSE